MMNFINGENFSSNIPKGKTLLGASL